MVTIDIKKIADKLVKEIEKDPDLISSLMKDPVKFVEKKTGIDLPDDQINKLITAIKTKLAKTDIDPSMLLKLASSVASKKSKSSSKKSEIDINDIASGISAVSKLLKK